MENINTNDLDIFLNEKCIDYKRTYKEPRGYKENGYIRYYLYQDFDIGRQYFIDICYDKLVIFEYDKLVTFEYYSEEYNYFLTSLFEEENEWAKINKEQLFKIILEHMSSYVESDDD